MDLRKTLFSFFLWWSVIGFSIWLGGTIFSMSVIVPMWSNHLPSSAHSFFEFTQFNRYIWNFFGPPFMIARNLPIIIALVLGWNLRPHRNYLVVASVITFLGIVFTFVYVYPINEVLMKGSFVLSDEDINTLANQWIIADRLRFGVMAIAYFFLLRTFQISREPTVGRRTAS